ncbi:hypothetical protein M0R01_00045 [bacterium]|nr:hypothetical protein [bacterium]
MLTVAESKTYDPFLAIKMAQSPPDFAWAYLLVTRKNSRKLMEKFTEEMRMQKIDDNDWETIGEWCKKLGLEDLKALVFHIPPHVPVSF